VSKTREGSRSPVQSIKVGHIETVSQDPMLNQALLSKFDSRRGRITDMIVSTGVDEEKFGMYKGKENLKF
jgi:hypothetical protein